MSDSIENTQLTYTFFGAIIILTNKLTETYNKLKQIQKLLCTIVLALVCAASVSCMNIQGPFAEQTGPAPSDTHSNSTPLNPVTPVVYELDYSKDENVSYEKISDEIKSNPVLKSVRADQLTLTADQYVALCSINPSVRLELITKVKTEDITLDLTKTESDISNKTISDKAAFEKLLGAIPYGHRLVMCDCNYSNEEMGALREKHPKLEFVWKLYLGEKWTLRTDDEAFSVMIYDYNYTRMTSKDIEVLKYTTNMKALDLGHQAITDLDTIGELSELRVLILADNKISDLTPLSKLKQLQYLELFVNRITDVSPLSECTELLDLNFGFNRSVADISGIYSLKKIERLWLPTTSAAKNKRDEIGSAFPNAKIIFEDVDSVSSGWRTHPRYRPMRAMFTNNQYDENFANYK